jgi:hypothetical protein
MDVRDDRLWCDAQIFAAERRRAYGRTKMNIVVRAICSLMLLLTIMATTASAQSAVVTGIVLNEMLNGFTKRIQNIIAQAGSEGKRRFGPTFLAVA